ncbi:MAG: branched-chain amino acid ABC transporter permease [Bacillati bacterium ANGP1]|uniref:Branched-chain amino acid ABC transporter permease n=1 Tax=Candidatus Segetimicrobium genomatis TaxID=2569760 RepID=A0A537JUV6_9BACT|nr:MAG: branched-chain amino acid ABC transporter permease [Terrabacteria group bacterium ANGP1]
MLGDIINGIAFGGLLFILASGFSLALGVIRVINIAHGAFYILAVYLGITIAERAGGFAAAIIVDSLVVMALAAVLHRVLLKRFHLAPLPQVLSMYGVTLIIVQAVRLIWGGYPEVMPTPPGLDGTLHILGTIVPVYRAFLIVVAAVLAIALWLLIDRTRIGALVRASVDDEEIARSIGINIERLSMMLFGFAGLLVGLGGALGAPLLGGYQGAEFEILTLTLVVVVLGGVGSIAGAFVGSLFVGVLWHLGTAAFAQYSYFVLFAPMILVLSLRPTGLLGKKLTFGE